MTVRTPDGPQKSYSRYERRTAVVDATEQDLLPFLESIAKDGGGVLFPVYDRYLRLLSMHAETLSKHFTLTIPPWRILQRVMDHDLLYGIARQAGLSTPAHLKPRDEADLRRIVAGLDLVNREYLLKTMPALGPAELSSGRATKVAGNDRAAIRESCIEIFERLGEYPLIVEVVPGEADQCIGVTMVVDRNQTPVLTYCTQRLRLQLYSRGGFVHPYELGSNIYCESTRDAEAIDAAERLVKATGYYGLITLEFRRDPRDQRLFLIKADPRVVRASSLSTALGLDTPTALYRVSVDGTLNAPQTYPTGVGWLWETSLLETFWENRDRRSMRQEIVAIARNFDRVNAFAYFSLSDPLPFIMHAQWRTRAWIWRRMQGLAHRAVRTMRRRIHRASPVPDS
jgi:predicted ATP-grasp superfamily ATP-dependent carboligase